MCCIRMPELSDEGGCVFSWLVKSVFLVALMHFDLFRLMSAEKLLSLPPL